MTEEMKGDCLLLSLPVLGAIAILIPKLMYFPIIRLFGVFYYYVIIIVSALGYLLFVVLAFVALLYCIVKKKKFTVKPLAFSLSVGFIVCYSQIFEVCLKYDFYIYLDQRMQLADGVVNNKIHLSKDEIAMDIYILHDKYSGLSDGDILLYDASDGVGKVLFFIERGVGDNFSGYMYRSDLSSPDEKDFGGDIVNLKMICPHWFYVVYT